LSSNALDIGSQKLKQIREWNGSCIKSMQDVYENVY
jgi:hypothetical protein